MMVLMEPPNKRRKIDNNTTTPEDIHSSQQLAQLLTATGDATADRHGLNSFSSFLHNAEPGRAGERNVEGHQEDETGGTITSADIHRRKQILVEYLNAVKPPIDSENDENTTYLENIMRMWREGSKANHLEIMSAVALALAGLLKVLSSMLELKQYGINICRTLLHRDQLECIAHNLSVGVHYGFVIGPTLRLVHEMVCFDGGELAEDVFRAKSFTFKLMGRNMRLRYCREGVEDPMRPFARTVAIRLFLSTLKFVSSHAQQELLSDKQITGSLFVRCEDDPPYLLREMLNTLESFVLGNSKIPNYIKVKVFNGFALSQLSKLYMYAHDIEFGSTDGDRMCDTVHSFLIRLCTTESYGILRPHCGFYPPTTESSASTKISDDVRSNNDIPIYHGVLFELAKVLKPWVNLKNMALLLAIFRAAPELVAPYFRLEMTYSFTPKLTSTWIGYAALLFEVAQLPIPPFFGSGNQKFARFPPPSAIVVDNLIPAPLDRNSACKCLTQPSTLIPFLTVRVLVVAIQKLDRIIRMYESTELSAWRDEIAHLKSQVAARLPPLKDIHKHYLSIRVDNFIQREVTSRLLRLYSSVLADQEPSVVDISKPLIALIRGLDTEDKTRQQVMLKRLDLENLVGLTSLSVGINWFTSAGGLNLSLFTVLLRLSFESQQFLSRRILATLHHVAQVHRLIPSMDDVSPFTCLVRALETIEEMSDEMWSFVDNCITRCGKFKHKYFTMALQLGRMPEKKPVSNHICSLTASIHEQFPFMIKSYPEEVAMRIAKLVATYVGFCLSIESKKQLMYMMKTLAADAAGNPSIAAIFSQQREDRIKAAPIDESGATVDVLDPVNIYLNEGWAVRPDSDQLHLPDMPLSHNPDEVLDNAALTRWSTKPVETLVHDGHIEKLLWLLTSEHASIRLEAAANIAKGADKIYKTSTYVQHAQIWLLLMELLETVSPTLAGEPALGIMVSFAISSIGILGKPLHPLYPLVNRFLLADPHWNCNRLPFVPLFLGGGPDAEGNYYVGLIWVLGFLTRGVISSRDVNLLASNLRQMERLLTYTLVHAKTNEGVRFAALGFLDRIAETDTGADMLVTKVAVLQWLEMLEERAKQEDNEREEVAYCALHQRITARLSDEVRQKWTSRR